jgi:hypothetical protein
VLDEASFLHAISTSEKDSESSNEY